MSVVVSSIDKKESDTMESQITFLYKLAQFLSRTFGDSTSPEYARPKFFKESDIQNTFLAFTQMAEGLGYQEYFPYAQTEDWSPLSVAGNCFSFDENHPDSLTNSATIVVVLKGKHDTTATFLSLMGDIVFMRSYRISGLFLIKDNRTFIITKHPNSMVDVEVSLISEDRVHNFLRLIMLLRSLELTFDFPNFS